MYSNFKSKRRIVIFIVVVILGGGVLVLYRHTSRNSELKALLEQKQQYLDIARKYPDDYSIFNQLALIYLQLEKHSKAIDYSQRAIFLEESAPESWNVYGIVLYTAYQKKSESEKSELLPKIQLVGKKLFDICKSQEEQLKDDMNLVEYLINSIILLAKAGENERANEAQKFALKIAEQWTKSDSIEKKRWGQIYLHQLQKGVANDI